ncbi:hypothetical protein BV20DRAFT_149300 [Pilatotrama ljubarskyi]|nr:hypothetical protein BV20DRAFT_149300 [Pilatotrama ljubarskyi]
MVSERLPRNPTAGTATHNTARLVDSPGLYSVSNILNPGSTPTPRIAPHTVKRNFRASAASCGNRQRERHPLHAHAHCATIRRCTFSTSSSYAAVEQGMLRCVRRRASVLCSARCASTLSIRWRAQPLADGSRAYTRRDGSSVFSTTGSRSKQVVFADGDVGSPYGWLKRRRRRRARAYARPFPLLHKWSRPRGRRHERIR